MVRIRQIVSDWWVPITVGILAVGLTTQSIKSHYRERKNLYNEVSKIAGTNEERMQLYNEFDREVPLPDLTAQEMRAYLSSHQRKSH